VRKLFLSLLFLHACSLCFSQRIIETIAGTGVANFWGEDGIVALNTPISAFDVAVDKSGNIFVSGASFDYRVRKIDHLTGIITTIAGNGTQGFSGDGGLATSAQLNEPRGITLDKFGNLFIADYWNNRVRRVDAITGIITTVAGNGAQDYAGDGGLATTASIYTPNDVAVDNSGNLYIADLNNNCVRKVMKANGIISTVAGIGKTFFGFSDDGSLATSAVVPTPFAIAVDKQSNIYIADWFNNRVRKVTASTGIISTIAGNGELGNAGDGGLAVNAQLYGPQTVEVDTVGNVYITEQVNEFINAKVRSVNHETGIISSIVGNGKLGHSGDGGPAEQAELSWGDHVAFDKQGNMYLADLYYIRKITSYPFPPPEIKYSCSKNGMSFKIDAAYPVYKVKWDFGDAESLGLNTSNELMTTHQFSQVGSYSIQAVIDSDVGRDSLNVMINVENCICHIQIPNVFTPNNDTYNDEYRINSDCVPELYKMSITNRWGQEMFTSSDINETWNGEYNGLDCSTGVYFLNVTYKFSGLPVRNRKEPLSLFR
jgi:gliding motility-associated-like protein